MSDPHRALKEVPLPRRMLGCRRDKRGYPIPFLMMPESQVHIDGRKQKRCAMEKLCMICGKKLSNRKWFIGGWQVAKNRLFSDPAMHEECARYAIQVCPFLSNNDMKYRKKYEDGTDFFTEKIPSTTDKRSETMVLMRTTGFKAIWWRRHAYVLANPWDYIEHWRDGERAPDPGSNSGFTLLGSAFDPGGRFAAEIEVIKG